MNIIGTFMKTKKAASDDMPPADRVMEMVRSQTEVSVKDLLSNHESNVQEILDAISTLERYGMIVHDKDDEGRDIIKLSSS